jgi:hypothetical protein
MKILIISHYFPPENNMAMIATLRPLSWAKYWSRAGHEVCVLTTAKRENQNLQSQLSQNISGNVRIEGVKYLLSRPEVKPAIKTESHKSGNSFGIYPFLRQILIKSRQLIGAGYLFYGSDFWILPAIKKGLEIYKEWKFDIIVSTFGPPASHIVARILKQKLNIFWVADYRDLWYGYDFRTARFPFSVIEENIEKYSTSKANLITTISDGFRENLNLRFNIKTATIPNGYEYGNIESSTVTTNFFASDGKIRLVHTGSIYPQKRDPSLLFEAINRLKESVCDLEKRIEILFYGWDLANLEDLISKYTVGDIVKIKGFVDRQVSLAVQKESDALIFLDWHNPKIDGILTGKIFEYMFSGTPILGIGASLNTAAGRLIKESETGVLLGTSVEAIANTIKRLIDGEKLEYSPKKEILSQYTRETLANKMLNEIMDAYSTYKNINK